MYSLNLLYSSGIPNVCKLYKQYQYHIQYDVQHSKYVVTVQSNAKETA